MLRLSCSIKSMDNVLVKVKAIIHVGDEYVSQILVDIQVSFTTLLLEL